LLRTIIAILWGVPVPFYEHFVTKYFKVRRSIRGDVLAKPFFCHQGIPCIKWHSERCIQVTFEIVNWL